MTNNAPDNDLCNRKYVLKCKVKFFDKYVRENIGQGKINEYQRKLVLLVPEQNDECMRFFQAWLPETVEEYFEIATQIGVPVHSPSRVAIKRGPDVQSEKPYLTVMSVGVEEVIKARCKEGDWLKVISLPSNEEDEADFARDASEGNFQVVE